DCERRFASRLFPFSTTGEDALKSFGSGATSSHVVIHTSSSTASSSSSSAAAAAATAAAAAAAGLLQPNSGWPNLEKVDEGMGRFSGGGSSQTDYPSTKTADASPSASTSIDDKSGTEALVPSSGQEVQSQPQVHLTPFRSLFADLPLYQGYGLIGHHIRSITNNQTTSSTGRGLPLLASAGAICPADGNLDDIGPPELLKPFCQAEQQQQPQKFHHRTVTMVSSRPSASSTTLTTSDDDETVSSLSASAAYNKTAGSSSRFLGARTFLSRAQGRLSGAAQSGDPTSSLGPDQLLSTQRPGRDPSGEARHSETARRKPVPLLLSGPVSVSVPVPLSVPVQMPVSLSLAPSAYPSPPASSPRVSVASAASGGLGSLQFSNLTASTLTRLLDEATAQLFSSGRLT
ncbi:unnamed protein product, partial [Protopolystoma xenopodis]